MKVNRIAVLWYVALPITLAGCGALPVGNATPDCPVVPTPKAQVLDKTCDVLTIVHFRKGDTFTDPTSKEILKNNEHYDALCNPVK